MNFRQRLTNVLTVLISILWVCGIYGETFGVINAMNMYLFVFTSIVFIMLTCIATAAVSFLMGTGFRPWHKAQEQ